MSENTTDKPETFEDRLAAARKADLERARVRFEKAKVEAEKARAKVDKALVEYCELLDLCDPEGQP